ncbi:hypothetical protein [Streptomyces sp. NPDC006355]|uniref:hypothetical protein n=1 Tax=Streptomyces sp. NPDC006355 TaxID=3156758 RepID=UPI0033A64F77
MYLFSALAGVWYVIVGALILTQSGQLALILGAIVALCGCTMIASSRRAMRGNREAPRHVRRSSSAILAVFAGVAIWWAATLVYSGEYYMIYAARDKLVGPIVILVIIPALIVWLAERRSRAR